MPGPVAGAGGVDRHHSVARRRAGGVKGRGDGLELVAPSVPRPVDEEGAQRGDHDRERDRRGPEDAQGDLAVPGRSASGDPGDGEDEPFEGQDVAVRRERDRRVDERPARDVDGRHERREGEQDRGVDEERPEVGRAPPGPPTDEHQRRQDEAAHERHEDHHGRDGATHPGRDQRADAHPEEMLQGRRCRDAVPLPDVPDEQDLARGGRRRERPEDGQLARPPRRHHQREQRDGTDRGRDRDRGPAAAVRPPRPPAIPGEGGTEGNEDEQSVVTGEGRQPGEQARQRRTRGPIPAARGPPSTTRR